MARSRLCTFFISFVLNTIIILAVLLFTPGLPPNIKYESYKVTPHVKVESNNLLDGVEKFYDGKYIGPESVAIKDGEIYTGVQGGKIIKITKNGDVKEIAILRGDCGDKYWRNGIDCGRPLGLRFDWHGKLIVADAYFGIFKVDIDSGTVENIVSMETEIDGKKPRFPDDLDVGVDGSIYWSDASTVSQLEDSVVELLGSGTGRLIKTDPTTKQSIVLLDNMHFPNGVQISEDFKSVLVAETARSRIWKYYIKGPKEGQSEIFVDGLPGYPDNIRSNGHGGYYVALPNIRNDQNPSVGDTFGRYPLIRKLILRLYGIVNLGLAYTNKLMGGNDFLLKTIHYIGHLGPLGDLSAGVGTMIVEISEKGQILRTFQTTNPKVRVLTQAIRDTEYTYFSTIVDPSIWRIKNKELDKQTK